MEEVPVTASTTSSNLIAIASFDGEAPTVVKAGKLRICVPTRSCVQFWATILACFIGIGVGVAFMIYQGEESAYYSVGLSLLGLSTGILIPGKSLLCRAFLCIILIVWEQGQILQAWRPKRKWLNPCPARRVKTRMTVEHGYTMSKVKRCINTC